MKQQNLLVSNDSRKTNFFHFLKPSFNSSVARDKIMNIYIAYIIL